MLTEQRRGFRFASCIVGFFAFAQLANAEVPSHSEIWTSVKDYGAIGDGRTDDTAAFNAVYAALTGSPGCGGNGGTIIVPVGTYVISSNLNWMCPNTGVVHLRGLGSGSSMYIDKGGSVLEYTGTGEFITSRNLQISGVRIHTRTGGTGIRFDRCNMDCWIDDIVVTGFSAYGINMSSATSMFSTSISRSRIYSNTGWGVYLSGNRITVRDSEITNNRLGGILLVRCVAITIEDNAIESNGGPGILAGSKFSTNVVIRDNYFESNTTAQIHADDTGSGTTRGLQGGTISFNYLNGSSTTTTGVLCEACGDVSLVGNVTTGHTYAADFTDYAYNWGNTWYPAVMWDTNEFKGKAGLQARARRTKGLVWGEPVGIGDTDVSWTPSEWLHIRSGVYGGGIDRVAIFENKDAAAGQGVELQFQTAGREIGTLVSTEVSYGASSTLHLTVKDGGDAVVTPITLDETGVRPLSTTFSALGAPADGVLAYCSDCTMANPCAGSGTGAIAKRLNSAWVCN